MTNEEIKLARKLRKSHGPNQMDRVLIQEARAALSPRTEGGQAEGYWKVSWREPNKEHNFKILQSKALAFEWAQRISAEHGIIIEHVDEAIEPEAEQ